MAALPRSRYFVDVPFPRLPDWECAALEAAGIEVDTANPPPGYAHLLRLDAVDWNEVRQRVRAVLGERDYSGWVGRRASASLHGDRN